MRKIEKIELIQYYRDKVAEMTNLFRLKQDLNMPESVVIEPQTELLIIGKFTFLHSSLSVYNPFSNVIKTMALSLILWIIRLMTLRMKVSIILK